jgi:signal transduction histidine kinase
MKSNHPFHNQPRSDISPRHGFTESHPENMLRDSVLIAATLTNSTAALILQSDTGTWYRDSSGLTSEEFADLEATLSKASSPKSGGRLFQEHGFQVVEALPLEDNCNREIGRLCVISQTPLTLSEAQREGLRLLAQHIQTIVTMDHQKMETRTSPRAPSAASFVPGLVHELGSFIFGISANLDAFEARFSEMEEMRKYGANIRRSLDRMSDFIVELREYGYPQRLSWNVLGLEPLLREAIVQHADQAIKKSIDLQLHIEGSLPSISADQQGLQSAFSRLIDLILQLEEAGGKVIFSVASASQGNRIVLHGYLDFSSTKFNNVDPARLFEPFYFRVSGLGRLTLPGARRVFEAHGGSLSAGPSSEGRMRISFMLPTESSYPLRSADQP